MQEMEKPNESFQRRASRARDQVVMSTRKEVALLIY